MLSKASLQPYPSPPMSRSPQPRPQTFQDLSQSTEALPIRGIGDAGPRLEERLTCQSPIERQRHMPRPKFVGQTNLHGQQQGHFGYRKDDTLEPTSFSIPPPRQHPLPHYSQSFYHRAAKNNDYTGEQSSHFLTPQLESQPLESLKSQRKSKGHVASACVPCKRAHLRCDAQRPCSRCLGNGKEDACIDVQHKKRGRPRLRDDRESRYDPFRLPLTADGSTRNKPDPVPVNNSVRQAPYKVPSHQIQHPQAEHTVGEQMLGGRSPDPWSTVNTRVAAQNPLHNAPIAYLTMGLNFAKASTAFSEAVGIATLRGRNLNDVVLRHEMHKTSRMHDRLVSERKRREPNHLPPILGDDGPAIEKMGFGREDLARFTIIHQDHLAFLGSGGLPRQHSFRLGIGKQGSYYVVLIFLNVEHWNEHESPVRQPSGSFDRSNFRPPNAAEAREIQARQLQDGEYFRQRSMQPTILPEANPHQRTSPPAISPLSSTASSLYDLTGARDAYSRPVKTPANILHREDLSRSAPLGSGTIQLPPLPTHTRRAEPGMAREWQQEKFLKRVDIGGLIDPHTNDMRKP